MTVTKQCIICNSKFEVYPYRKDTAKFCSKSCSNYYRHRILKEDFKTWSKTKKRNYGKKICGFCSVKFEITGNKIHAKNRFCSWDCLQEYHKLKLSKVKCNCCDKEISIIPYHIKHHKQHFCSEKCKWKILTQGENNITFNNWSSFKPYDKSFNNRFKRAIRKRDNQICMLCKIHREKLNRAFDVHHINYDKLLSVPQNCISLCRSCHTKTNSNRKHWMKFFQDLLSEKYNYQYSENKEVILEVKNGCHS